MNDDFIEPCFCFDEANLVDKIRQKVINLQNDQSLDEITDFLDGSLKYLENDLSQDIASELYAAIFTFFSQFIKELMPLFDEIFKKSRTNANYIYLTSFLLSYFTHIDLNLTILDYKSFIDATINEICLQITNQSGNLKIFGHEIAPQFQNDFILNTILSSTLNESISPKLFNYIFYHYWQKKDKKFDSFLLDIIKSGLNTILPQTDSSNDEILEFLSKKDDQIFLKMSIESFSIIKSAIIYIKYESKVQIKGLDAQTIFQFAAVITVLLPFLSDFSPEIPPIQLFKFANEIEIQLFKVAINHLQNNNILKIFDYVLTNYSLLTVTHFVGLQNSLDFLNILIQQLINNEYKSDKIILLNLYFEIFNQVKPSITNQLSDLFTFIFNNLKNEFYDCRENFISHSFDLHYVLDILVVNQMMGLETEEEAIQKIYFFEKICFNKPCIMRPSYILMKTIDHEFENKNIANLKLIEQFLERNFFYEEIDKMRKLPLISNKIKGGLNFTDFDEILIYILKDDELKYQNYLLEKLFKLMMKDEDNLFCYLSYLVSYDNQSYDINYYLDAFYIDEYHDTFLKVTKELFQYVHSKSRLILRNNFKIENFKISEFGISIVSKIFESIKDNPDCNYQAFICLKSIACTVPILFNSNIQQIFDSILQPFNNLYLLFENNRKNDKTILLTKTAYASLSFLLSSFQSSLVLDHFVKWLFPSIEKFSNSQIFGFLYILRCLSTNNTIFNSFIPSDYKKYDIFNKIVGFLNRKITEGSNFEKNYKLNIFGFLERVFYGFSIFNNYMICQNEMLSEKENKFTYFYSNIFSTFINYRIMPIIAIDDDIKEFIELVDEIKKFWFINRQPRKSNNMTVSKFCDELPHYEECFVPIKNFDGHISIQMAKYLIMKPFWIYDLILYNNVSVYSKEQSDLYLKTINELLELQKQAQENPQDKENRNVNELDVIQYFTPIINRPKFIEILIDNFYYFEDDLFLVITKMIQYPLIYEKIIESINLKIIENANDPSYLINRIETILRVLFCRIIDENLLNSFINVLINIILTPKYRNNHELLFKISKYLIVSEKKLPIRTIQLIMFLLLINSDVSIFLALRLCNIFNSNELSVVNDMLLNLFDKVLNSNKIELLKVIIHYVPSIIKMRKVESIPLLMKEFENYYNNKTDNCESFQLICRLLNALAPNRFNSTTLSNVIESSTLIPSFIKETGKEFWDIYEENMKLINENPFLLNDELSFLLNYPEIVDFKVRSSYFKKKMMNRIDEYDEFNFKVDFDNLLESSFQRLHNVEPNDLLKKFRIEVVNSIVVDVGGVTRNWFTSLAKELFNQNYGIFDCSKNMRGYKPSCNSSIHPDHLEYFKFAGMFIARALIEGISIDAHLTSSFCKQILHRKTCLKDLEDIDENMYKSSNLILENDASELYLTFSMDIGNLGEIKTIELKKNGSEIPVTNDNKVEFVNLRANYILYDQIKDQINAFNNGFDSLIPHEFLRIFTPSELDLLICGVPSIDVNDFRDNMTYIPPYNKDTLVVKLFFEVIYNWGNDDLAKLLLFMTGSSRVPVNGFKEFVEITGEKLKIGPGGKRENWPQSHTCFNELDLPEYQTKEELETKLRRSMEYYNTFGIK